MQGFSDQLLTGPVFAIDQDGGFGVADAVEESVEILHRRRLTDHAVKAVASPKFLA